MAVFSSSRFFESGAPVKRAPTTSIACGTPHRRPKVLEIAVRVRAVAAEVALFLWTGLVVGFLLLVVVGCFLTPPG
jgi:hypothetical protein